MTWARGVGIALCAALTHTAIDSTRKYAVSSLGLPTPALVLVVAVLEALISCGGVAALVGFHDLTFAHPLPFWGAAFGSAALLLFSKFLYMRALAASPLSLTIPYLALTPVYLVGIAYVVLGELPSPSGLAGVVVVALGGYLLNRRGGAGSGIVLSKSADALDVSGGGDCGGSGTSLAHHAAQRTASLHCMEAALEAGGDDKLRRGGKPRRTASAIDMLQAPMALLVSQQEPGVALMSAVAFIWGVTASLDKMGVVYGPSVWIYLAAQRAISAVLAVAYITLRAPGVLGVLRTHLPLLVAIALLETLAVVLFLLAVRFLLVSYVVAIKRCNVLFSVLMGGLIFRESILRRLPYIVIMLLGVTLIVVEPDSTILHAHTHHT